MTERKIHDYLHFYLGGEIMCNSLSGEDVACKIINVSMGGGSYVSGATKNGQLFNSYGGQEGGKLILRPLSDMTEEEWKKCFELSRGMVDQSISDKIQKMAHNEILITLGYKQFSFGYLYGEMDNDVRIGHGLSFYLKSYLIKDELSVSAEGIETNKSLFNEAKEERIDNIDHIFIYLLSKSFDLFGLIESGLAINKTTLKP